MITQKMYGMLFAGLICVGSAFGDVSGSPLKNYGNQDTCNGCMFPIIQFSAQNVGLNVASFSIYAGADVANANGDYWVTPLLLEQSSNSTSNFSIIGIGASDTNFNASEQNSDIPFSLVAGTAKVQDTNTFFGYIDGLIKPAQGGGYTVTPNPGTISTTYPGNGGPVQYFIGAPINSLAINDAFTATAFTSPSVDQTSRTYALQVTTPEPDFYSVMGLGLSGLAALALIETRKRRRA